jgi:hypothetical protein
MSSFRLKIWHIEQTCMFELSWGKGQQLTAKLPFPNILKTHYKRWQEAYMDFYRSKEFQESTLRARVDVSGTMATPAIDWRARLAQAEAELTSEFHHWLSSAELLKIRKEIASGGQSVIKGDYLTTHSIDVFLTCDSLELERLPWETWEIGTEFAASSIRLVRTPANIEAEIGQRKHQGKMRILAILGDDTGLNFQQEREALKSLSSVADLTFVGWQKGKATDQLLEDIQQAIANPDGWDILFFAGHSNETNLTGGELTISPNQSILVSEIAPQLLMAKQHGLQFAIFNSCKGLSIANSLISLGLGQVAIMREPIHNQVAQEFLVRFLRQMATCQDVQDAMRSTCQSFKLDKNLTYPSAYLIPSLFRHPNSVPFRLKPFGWQEKLKQWLPTKVEAIALTTLISLSAFIPAQEWLLAQRILVQARYRQLTGQFNPVQSPPILLVQIDDQTIQNLGISSVSPMDRQVLAQLVDQATALNARVIGLDYLLDTPQPKDAVLRRALEASVTNHQSWLVFGSKRNKAGQWIGVRPEIASPHWSLSGDLWTPYWQIRPLPWSDARLLPFSYTLATALQLQNPFPGETASTPPRPNLQSQFLLSPQFKTYTQGVGAPLITQRMKLHPITAFSYNLCHSWGEEPLCYRWLQPLLDFSIPPQQVYQSVSAWKFLQQPTAVLQAGDRASLQDTIVIIAPGGYDQAGITKIGEDNPPLPSAIAHWRQQQGDFNEMFTGGEIHAYMTHHFLKQHLVVPIPDLWLLLLTGLVAKAVMLHLKQRQLKPTLGIFILGITTLSYGMISLQLYIIAAILLPWLLPSAVVCSYLLPYFWSRRHHA